MHYLRDVALRLLWLAYVVIQVCHMVAWLIAMHILPYHAGAEYGQLLSFCRLVCEQAVDLGFKSLCTAHQSYQTVYIVLHRPQVVPGIALANIFGVVLGLEWLHKFTVLQAWLHEAGCRVIHILVVLCTRFKCGCRCIVAKMTRKHGNAMVVVGIFERLAECPVLPFSLSIGWYIAKLLVKPYLAIIIKIGCCHAHGKCPALFCFIDKPF